MLLSLEKSGHILPTPVFGVFFAFEKCLILWPFWSLGQCYTRPSQAKTRPSYGHSKHSGLGSPLKKNNGDKFDFFTEVYC